MDPILPSYHIDVNHHFEIHDRDGLEKFLRLNFNAHSHDYYILSFLYEGSLAHLSDFQDEQVYAPAVLMLDIDQVHTHPDMSNCRMVSIAFSTGFLADQNQRFLEKINKVFARPFINISSEALDQLDEIIKIITTESSRKNRHDELIKALLNVLIVQCSKLSEIYPATQDNKNLIYNGFRKLLKENFNRQHQLKFYADRLNISSSILTKCVKSSTYKTPKQLIDQHLLLEAKRLLYWSNVPVKEIAWQLGFETDSYFNRFFKKHTGKTPKEFHRAHLKANKDNY
ncbi:MAG: AraC family transcriptional regulator [Chryseobacterium sp.]|nr:MAG: AraC family transcriptional regulator [Chryseobacterium sp.]